MNRSIRRLAGALALAAFVAGGCVRMPAGVTSSTLPITARDQYVQTGRVSGRSWAIGLFNFAIMPYGAYDAIQNAKKDNGVDGLIDVTAENEVWWLTLIIPLVTYHKISVEGEGIQFTTGGPDS
ncbi:MAG: hypothetical protein KF858_08500 [Candidatus Sumerlaeia bacterium]|nr:hypothetical protein [Candidatus Sumerlaeia bacterium]